MFLYQGSQLEAEVRSGGAFADVSDPTTSFDFVQIRDRDNTEGRPWVEQILGQRNSLEIGIGAMVLTERFSN